MAGYKKKKRKEMAENVLQKFGESLTAFGDCARCAQIEEFRKKRVIADNRGGLPLLQRKA